MRATSRVLLCVCLGILGAAAAWAQAPARRQVLHNPHFSLFQNSPRLKDLFVPGADTSMICSVTSLAQIANYQRRYREPSFPDLRPAPKDYDGNGTTDGYDLIHYFKNACHTSLTNGTHYASLPRCLRAYYATSGYGSPRIRFIENDIVGWEYDLLKIPGVQVESRMPRWADLTRAVDQDLGVVLNIGFFDRDPQGEWKMEGGHSIVVLGYSETKDAQGKVSERELVVMDPWENYRGKGDHAYTVKKAAWVTATDPKGDLPPIGGGVVIRNTGEGYPPYAAIYGLMTALPE